MNENGTFKKKTGYTTVQNPVARDSLLPSRARGLYVMIESYITMPDLELTKTFIQRKCLEGKKAFDSMWDELKSNGYLKVHMYPNKGNWRAEYELLDKRQDGPHTIYYTADGKVSKTNLTRASKKPGTECEKQHIPQKGIYAKGIHPLGSNAEGIYADGNNAQGNNANGGNIIKPIVKTKDKYSFCNTQSINPNDDETDAIDKYKKYESIVKTNIEYDRLLESYSVDDIDGIVSTILEHVLSEDSIIRIGSTAYPADTVKSKLLKLNPSHIEYVFERMNAADTSIQNIKAYLLKALYSAPDTMGMYYANRVAHDFKNE